MHSRTASRVTEWPSRPFGSSGTDLPTLVETEFTGAVTVGESWLFLLNGRGIGLFGGSLEDFEDGTGTVYESPDPALPLLFTMVEQGGETKAQYYSEKTAIAEVDETLSSSSFTGFIELSENVISGDYYVVYYGGRSMSVAFVGSGERLLTGDEAFEKANDEVGIFEVTAVDIDVLDLPASDPTTEPAPETGTDADSEPGTDDSPAALAAEPEESDLDPDADPEPDLETGAESTEAEPTEPETESEPESEPVSVDAGSDSGTTVPDDREAAHAVDAEQPTSGDIDVDDGAEGHDSPGSAGSTAVRDRSVNVADPDPNPDPDPDPDPIPESDRANTPDHGSAAAGPSPTTREDSKRDRSGEPGERAEAGGRDPFAAEAEWRERKEIPSLDPELTAAPDEQRSARSNVTTTPPTGAGASASASAGASGEPEPEADTSGPRPAGQTATGTDEPPTTETPTTAQPEPARADVDSARLESLREDLEAERSKRTAVESELEALQAEVDRLEAALDEARASRSDSSEQQGEALDPVTALQKTNLFIRYGSKGQATLEQAHAGDTDRESVNVNLQLEEHTNFDSSAVTVDGQPFSSFLPEAIEYQFVEWFIRDLLYEIQATGKTGGLKDLYDAIPRIDRADIRGSMSLQYMADGEEHREQQEFDLILRDRMGRPLVVVDINNAREPATTKQMAELVGAAERAKETTDELAAAFFVTTSYFEPGALETAAEATSSGFLRSSSRLSYVKLSRKRGFHLCLVEARDGEFHISVPEL